MRKFCQSIKVSKISMALLYPGGLTYEELAKMREEGLRTLAAAACAC